MGNANEPRPCERQCPGAHGEIHWRHHSRFGSRKRKNPDGSVRIVFDRLCKDCEQILRVEKKNEDRPRAIIYGRAEAHRNRFAPGVPVDFFWVNMNYQAQVPLYRALTSPEGLCPCCGHAFDDEKDIQIEHRAPPRKNLGHPDWARLHGRNLGFGCGNCNGTKTNKEYERWLDEQEDARQTNEADRLAVTVHRPLYPVDSLFGDWGVSV